MHQRADQQGKLNWKPVKSSSEERWDMQFHPWHSTRKRWGHQKTDKKKMAECLTSSEDFAQTQRESVLTSSFLLPFAWFSGQDRPRAW